MEGPAPGPTVGLLGLGNMGAAIAARLGPRMKLLAFDPDAERARLATAEVSVQLVQRQEDVARADIIVLSLPSPKVSAEVISALVGEMKPGSVIVETSTVSPADIERLHKLCRECSIGLVDAAILAGVKQMYEGDTVLLIGGGNTDIVRAQPVLDAIAATQLRLGPPGSGMAAKVINNAVAHAVMVVLAEAGALAAASSVPRAALAEILARPDGGLTRPLTHRFVERVLRGDYSGGMPTETARKDSILALNLGEATATPLFAIEAADTVYELAVRHGLKRQDYSVIARLWEDWTGRSMADTDSGE